MLIQVLFRSTKPSEILISTYARSMSRSFQTRMGSGLLMTRAVFSLESEPELELALLVPRYNSSAVKALHSTQKRTDRHGSTP